MSFTLSRRHGVRCAVLCLLTAWPHLSAGQNVYANRFGWDGALDHGQGRIVVGGYFFRGNGGSWGALTRVLPTGDVDPEFGYAGIPASGTSFITDVRITAGHRIWVAGHHAGRPFAARFTSGGDVDDTFLSNADPGVVIHGTVQAQGCPWSGLNEHPQVVEQSYLVPGISVVRKAVLLSQCFVNLMDF